MQGPATLVDVQAIRFDAELHDLGAEFLEDQRREQVGRAVTAIHDDLHPRQIACADALLGVFDVAAPGVVDAGRLADLVRAHPGDLPLAQDLPLDRQLQLVGQLVAIGPEDLEPIILIRVVRSRQHDAGAATHRLRQVRHARRRHRADEEDVHAARDESAGQRGLEHVAGDARVLADDDAVVVGAIGFQDPRDRLAGTQRDFRGDRVFVRFPANTVRAEESGGHGLIRQKPIPFASLNE